MYRSHFPIGLAALSTCALLVIGCSGDDRFTASELTVGVPLEVENSNGLVESATLYRVEDTAWFTYDLLDEDSEVTLIEGDVVGRDWIAIYATGPFCGRLPAVSASTLANQVILNVQPKRLAADECDDLEYIEAIAFDLTDDDVMPVFDLSSGG